MRNKKRNIIIMSVCLIAVLGSLPIFAAGSSETAGGNALWFKAADIVDASASILPTAKTIIWEEMSPSGQVTTREEAVIYYSEDKAYTFSDSTGELLSGQKIAFDYSGDVNVLAKRSAVNDGLLWTPFDDDVADADVKVVNTGMVESINGNECSVFEYTMYRDSAQYGYNFEESVRDSDLLLDDYLDVDSNVFIKVEGKTWIDGNGVLRQLESNIAFGDADYREIIVYDYNGSVLYPIESVLEGSLEVTAGKMVASTTFRVTETMTGFWMATDFSR